MQKKMKITLYIPVHTCKSKWILTVIIPVLYFYCNYIVCISEVNIPCGIIAFRLCMCTGVTIPISIPVTINCLVRGEYYSWFIICCRLIGRFPYGYIFTYRKNKVVLYLNNQSEILHTKNFTLVLYTYIV